MGNKDVGEDAREKNDRIKRRGKRCPGKTSENVDKRRQNNTPVSRKESRGGLKKKTSGIKDAGKRRREKTPGKKTPGKRHREKDAE